jgi:hypothetical protein
MHELGWTALAIVPALLLAIKSRNGSLAGYFVLWFWVSSAAVLSFLGVKPFLGATLALVVIAVAFNKCLDIKGWWTRRNRQ